MTKMILISHGKLSVGMAYSAQMIAGETENLYTFGLMPGGDVNDDVIEPVKRLVQSEPETQFIILSDLYCGSVYNASYELQQEPNVLIGTGMNLYLVINLLLELDEGFTAERFAKAMEDSRQYTLVMPELNTDDTDEEDFF